MSKIFPQKYVIKNLIIPREKVSANYVIYQKFLTLNSIGLSNHATIYGGAQFVEYKINIISIFFSDPESLNSTKMYKKNIMSFTRVISRNQFYKIGIIVDKEKKGVFVVTL